MPNLSNINVTITADDKTGPGIASAKSNLSSLAASFGSIGNIASGVFGGILGINVFRGITSGIGSVITSAFGLNNTLTGSRLAAQSMIETISQTEPQAESAFGAAAQAARQFERTMREIREREADGMADYADKVDDIKNKIIEAEQNIAAEKTKRYAEEKRQIEDLTRTHEETVTDLNKNLTDENTDYAERVYDMNNTLQDRLASIEEQKKSKTATLNKDILALEAQLALASTAMKAAQIQAQIDLKTEERDAILASLDEEARVIQERADHEVAVAKEKHDRKLEALNLELARENEAYDRKKKRIEDDAKTEIASAEEAANKKVATLQKQLAKEEELHTRFLRDITEAYADANEKMELGGGGGGATGRRTLDFGFDFAEAYRKMNPDQINKFLDDLQRKYVEIGIRSPFNVGEIQQFGKSVIQFTEGSANNMGKLVDMAQALAAKNPMQGMQGATLAMVELLGSGNIQSMTRRFDIPRDTFAGIDKAKNATELIDLMDQALQRQGITYGLVEARAKTLGGAWQNISETFNLVTAAIAKPVWDWLTDRLVNLNKWLFTNQDTLTAWANSIGKVIGAVFSPFGESIMNLAVILAKFWNEHGTQIMKFFTDVGDKVTNIATPAIALLGNIWTTVQGTLESTIIPGMGRIFDTLRRLWEEIAPEVQKTLKFLTKWWTEHSNEVMAVVKFVWSVIEFAIRFALDTIKMVIKVALALIRGDWESVWKAIETFGKDTLNNFKDFVTGVWSAIGTIVRNGINSLIDQINNFIRAANNATRGKKIGPVSLELSIPEIPKLAAGGIVNQPTLAMLGESGPEAIMPLDKARGNASKAINIYVTGNYVLDDRAATDLADKVGTVFANQLRVQGKYLS